MKSSQTKTNDGHISCLEQGVPVQTPEWKNAPNNFQMVEDGFTILKKKDKFVLDKLNPHFEI